MQLSRFMVSVQVFDPDAADPQRAHVYDLPVDSPDAEHAVSAAMSNAVAFTTKTDGDTMRPVAFRAVAVRTRD